MLPPEPIAARRGQEQLRLGADGMRFRELIAKVGSGERTSTGLSRSEAEEALTQLLQGRVQPAQAGAFLIAHRLRRPSPAELAGMVDAYLSQGPQLPLSPRPVVCFGTPFDGRCRTAPILPLTALVLNSADLAVVLQGGRPMPVKYGATQAELCAALGLPLAELEWAAMGSLFQQQGLALLHQPRHFPAAEALIPIRELIGKRPPIATLELLWSCYPGPALQVSGFVHAPTEQLAWQTWTLIGRTNGLTLKGLEGGVDLPTSRVSIGGHQDLQRGETGSLQRLILHAKDHGLGAAEPELDTLKRWRGQALAALQGEGPLLPGLIWNAGVLLWRSAHSPSLEAGLERARTLLLTGAVEARRQSLAAAMGR
jgi:anthranilate phosphoribosyltransferase